MTRWTLISLTLTVLVASAFAWVGFARTDLFIERIPTHWDLHMNPDAWTDRENFVWQLLLFPGIMLLVMALLVLLPRISPRNFDIDRFADTFGFVMTSLVAFFGYLGALFLWGAIDESPPYWDRLFVASFFVLFAVMGNVMGKVQRNFWMGVRTPWTLASEAVWTRTHRLAAWLWVAAGLAGGAAVLVGVPFWIAFVGLTGAAIWPAIFSLLVYRSLEKEGKL
jgi:uncharacterized membrane protein